MKIIQKQQRQLNKIFKESNIVLAYIFGSFAKDKAGFLSDFDLAILFSEKIPKAKYFDKELKITNEIGENFKIDRVDIVNLATANNPLLKYNAVFNGKLVFVKDQKLRFELEKKIRQEYEDTKYLREIQYALMVKRLKEGVFGKAEIKSRYLEKILNKK